MWDLVPWPRTEPRPPAFNLATKPPPPPLRWEPRVLTTGPPGSPCKVFSSLRLERDIMKTILFDLPNISIHSFIHSLDFPGGSDCKESACNAGDLSLSTKGNESSNWHLVLISQCCHNLQATTKKVQLTPFELKIFVMHSIGLKSYYKNDTQEAHYKITWPKRIPSNHDGLN